MDNHSSLIKERNVMDYRQLADPAALSVNEVLDQASRLEGEEVCVYGHFVSQFEHVALHHVPRAEMRPAREVDWGTLSGQKVHGSCIWVAAESWDKLAHLSGSVIYITGKIQFAQWKIHPMLRRVAKAYPKTFQFIWAQPYSQAGHFGHYPGTIRVTQIRGFENRESLCAKATAAEHPTCK
jgi:hypothetical protein